MPKMKTHKGMKKRFKVSATGKVSHKRCGSSHLNSHKSGKRIGGCESRPSSRSRPRRGGFGSRCSSSRTSIPRKCMPRRPRRLPRKPRLRAPRRRLTRRRVD